MIDKPTLKIMNHMGRLGTVKLAHEVSDKIAYIKPRYRHVDYLRSTSSS